jgi:hypothetical protein
MMIQREVERRHGAMAEREVEVGGKGRMGRGRGIGRR